jgi:hypothetical protein
MTITVTVDTNWKNDVAKSKTLNALNVAGKFSKIWLAHVAWGTSGYTNTGVTVNLDSDGVKVDDYLAVIPAFTDSGLHFVYDKSTGKVKLYGQNATGTNPTPVAALAELESGSTLADGKVFDFLVIAI